MQSTMASAKSTPTAERNDGGYRRTSHAANARSGTGQQPVRTGGGDEPGEPLGLGRCDTTAQRSQPVIAPPLVVAHGTSRRFDDPACREHAMKSAVQCAWLNFRLAAAEPRRLLHDGVTVAFVVRQREEHLKFHGPERHMCSQNICGAHI